MLITGVIKFSTTDVVEFVTNTFYCYLLFVIKCYNLDAALGNKNIPIPKFEDKDDVITMQMQKLILI